MPTGRVKPLISFDAERIFERAGGSSNSLRDLLLVHHGAAPSLPAIQMWKSRGVIPSGWLPPVLYALMKEGHRVFELMVRRKA